MAELNDEDLVDYEEVAGRPRTTAHLRPAMPTSSCADAKLSGLDPQDETVEESKPQDEVKK